MKRKRLAKLLSYLLTGAALLGILGGCAGDTADETTAEEVTAAATVEYDLSKYTLIRPEEMSSETLQTAVSLRKSINSSCNLSMSIKDDWEKGGVTEEIENQYEILFGNTNRSASSQALSNVTEASSYVIAVIGNKIVINASMETSLPAAAEHFLSLIKDGKLILEENFLFVSDPVPMLDIVKDGASEFSVVYMDGLDATLSSTNEKDLMDVEPTACASIRTLISELTGVKPKIATDWHKPEVDMSSAYEILVGECDRDEYLQFANELGADEYGYKVIGNKIVICGHNLTTLQYAVDKFEAYLKTVVGTDAEGRKTLAVAENLEFKATQKGWYTDFPAFDSEKTYTGMDCGDDCLEYYYTDVTREQYDAYCKKLESEGFILYQSNEITGNPSATYTSKAGMLHVYFTKHDGALRIISCASGKYNLIPHLSAETYTKVTDTKITCVGLNYSAGNFGNCYIITLEDGSFVVIDGGGYSAEYGDDERLFNLLTALNKRTDGKIVIAAWVLSHEHWDHYTNFYNMVIKHGSSLTIEACYMNTPAASFVTNSNNPNYYNASKFSSLSSAVGGTKLIKIHTGQKFYVRNAEFEVLFTQEDINPGRCNYFNETSNVLRMTAGGNTVMWLGDSKNYASAALTKRYGSYIESDIVQVAHHGYDAVTSAVYNLIKPQTALWPTDSSNILSITGNYPASNTVYNLVGSKNIIFSGPTQTITLPYKNGDTIVKEAY